MIARIIVMSLDLLRLSPIISQQRIHPEHSTTIFLLPPCRFSFLLGRSTGQLRSRQTNRCERFRFRLWISWRVFEVIQEVLGMTRSGGALSANIL